MDLIQQLESAIIKGNIKKVTEIAKKCLDAGHHPSAIIDKGVLSAMKVVGEKWKTYEYFIPDVLVSAIATKQCLNIMHNSLKVPTQYYLGKAIAGTVQGDVHDLGKNIVVMFMEAAGFEVIDLGVDVPPENFVKAIKKEKANLLLLSCLYTVTMPAMEDTLIKLKEAGLKEKVKAIIGGAPITQGFADSIGADGFGMDAIDGVRKAKELFHVE